MALRRNCETNRNDGQGRRDPFRGAVIARVGPTTLPDPETTIEEAPASSRARATLRRASITAFYVTLGLVFLLLIGLGALYLRLAAGPIDLAGISPRVAGALAGRLGPGWTVEIGGTTLELSGARPAVRTAALDIRNPAGLLVVRAPHALVSLDPVWLVTGSLAPREVEFRDLQLRAQLRADGSLSFAPQDVGELPATAEADAAPASAGGPSAVAAAVASLLAPLAEQSSIIGALDRATVKDARLTLLAADGRERAVYPRVGGAFERLGAGGRRVVIDLEGPNGPWRVRGEVTGGSERRADLAAENVPLGDLMLLGGLSGAPVSSDLKLSGRVSGLVVDGRLSSLDARLESAAGVINRPTGSPLRIDRLSGEASWDEAGRVLRLPTLAVASEGTELRFQGELGAAADGLWRLTLSGPGSVVAGLGSEDSPFRIDELAATIAFKDTGLAVERLTFKGESLDVALSAASVPGRDGFGVTANVEVRNTEIRRFIRLWPDPIASQLRRYLVANLKSGLVERFSMKTALDQAGLVEALADRPIPDEAVNLLFTLSDGRLAVVDGLPPLRRLAIDGKVTGTRAQLSSRSGRIDLPDGRRLAFMDGTYDHADYDVKTTVAQIGFRVGGGVDAVAALLGTPLLKEAGAPELDPAQVKGRADFRVGLKLAVHRMPSLADLPLSVSGNIFDLSTDRALGREKLEGANLAINYESGAFGLKGEGRIGGSPATIEVQKPRGGPGDVIVNLTLDEAARARRSLPVAPQLAGPVPVKVVASLAAGPKGAARIEADLSRAAIDGLLPGWTKPAGRPGRLSFTLGEGDAPDLRDLALDSGPVQLRGSASFTAGGVLEKADLPTLRLSTGDDMRGQIDRAAGAYRISIKGNTGDARPVLRMLTGGQGAQKGEAGSGPVGRDAGDFDLDLALNILTGHNGEALTGVTARVSSRSRDLRALQFNGRFRQASVDVQLAKRDAGAPILAVTSADAGATLRFLDIYRRMVGGRLTIDARANEGSHDGRIEIDTFALKGEPALRSITAQGAPLDTNDERGLAPIARGEVDQVQFNKLSAEFRRNSSRAEFKEVTIYGAQVGFNLNGFIDFARDRMDVSGTFVPAYILNNAFSQVPVVGILLGGPNEGLFAIDFRVAGPMASPALTVNPLTAVAPGILRKLFGWMLPDGQSSPEATGANPSAKGVNPAAPARRVR